MEGLKVRDIMTEDVVYVDKNADLDYILYLMERNSITKIPVLEEGRLIGIVTDGEIAYKLGSFRKRDVNPAHLHASSVMVRDFDVISPDTLVKDIIKTVGLPGLTMLPVLDKGKLVGVITKADLLPLVKSENEIEKIMTRNVITVKPGDRVVHARRLLIENDIARLPVVEEGVVFGVIAEIDIAMAFADLKRSVPYRHQKRQVEELCVEDAMNTPAITAKPKTKVRDAAKIMIENNIGCLPIVEERIEGIITRTDLIKTLK